MPNKPRFVALAQRVRQLHPHLDDPARSITDGLVRVGGVVVTNPRARVRRGAAVTLAPAPAPPRGTRKLTAALEKFAVPVAGRTALDVGASTGGFTRALLAAGARRVYAVDAGYGQLLGSLRADDRVVNLERTNLGVLTTVLVPDVIEIITIDLSYLSLAKAAPQIEAVAIAPTADLIALVKPMYELGLARPPAHADQRAKAVEVATAAFEGTGWHAPRWIQSPLPGRRGSVEYLLHLRRGHPDASRTSTTRSAKGSHPGARWRKRESRYHNRAAQPPGTSDS